jgi:hypothetical protein
MDTVTSVVSIANVFAKNSGLCLPWDKETDIKSLKAWEFLKKKTGREIDIEKISRTIFEKTDSVKDVVNEMLTEI